MTLLGPLFWYELRRLPRRRRSLHLWRVLYASALLVGLVVVYLRVFRDLSPIDALVNPGQLDRAGTAAFANSFLMAFLAVQQIAVIVLTPIYAAGSIADEKERGTLDFLLSSPLSRFQIVFGKVCSRLVFVGSIIAAGLPVLMLTFLFGGVDLEHLLAGFAVSAITAIFSANLGVLLACLKPNLRATLPGMVLAHLGPALFGLCGFCTPAFSVASPVAMLGVLFAIWLENDPIRDSTRELVSALALVYLPLSAGLLAWAVATVGTRAKAQIPPQTSLERKRERINTSLDYINPSTRRTYWVPPLGDGEDPILWKEKHFHPPIFDPQRGCAAMAFVSAMAGLAFIALVVLFVTLAEDLARSRAFSRTANLATLIVLVPVVIAAPASLGVRIAPRLGRERAGQTLQKLFSTPLERKSILMSTVKGVLYRDRHLLCFLASLLAVCTFAGGVDFSTACAVAVLIVGCEGWGIAFGLWLSVQIATPTRASLLFLGVWGGILLLPWFVGPFFGPEIGYRIELTCPPYGIAKALLSAQFKSGDGNVAVNMAFATGLGMLLLAAAFGWHAARTFEREGR